MYLTGGQYKGRKILVPNNVKPTLSKTRQSVFNMLANFEFKNNTFLDMFSGSGLMGLEAISRGYNALGLENNKQAISIIKQNYKNLDIKPNILFVNALNFKSEVKFDVVYLDPPWDMDYSLILKQASNLINNNGVIVVEFDNQRGFSLEEIIQKQNLNLKVIKNKKYGRSLISLLQKEEC